MSCVTARVSGMTKIFSLCQGSSCRQIVRYLNGHGVPSGLFGGKRLIEIGNQVVRILKAAGQPHKVGRNARCGKLTVVHLAVRRAGGMQAACPRIGDVRLDGGKLQVAHETARRRLVPPLTPNEMTPQEPFGRYFCASS